MAANHAGGVGADGNFAMNNQHRFSRKKDGDARSKHGQNLKVALTEREEARDELFVRISAMPSDERARLEPTLFSRLTPDQLCQLLDHDQEKINATIENSIELQTTPYSGPSPKVKSIQTKPPFVCALKNGIAVAAVAGGIAIVAVIFGPRLAAWFSAPPIRPVNAAQWPVCRRLNAHIDGCIYHVQAGLTWDEAATLLRMPVAQLRNVNSSLLSLQPNSWLVIWRGRGTLTR